LGALGLPRVDAELGEEAGVEGALDDDGDLGGVGEVLDLGGVGALTAPKARARPKPCR
jgi:hypothetical protein